MESTSTTVAAQEDHMSMTTSSHSPASPSYVVRRVGRGARRISRGLGLRLQPRPAWERALTGVVGLGYLVVAFFALGFFDVPSGFNGWLPTALGYIPGLLLLTLGLGIGRWPVAVAWAVGSALAMGLWAHYMAAPIHERIEAEAMEVGTPAGWTVVEDGAWTGNTWGLWNDWPEVTYTYASGDSARVAAEEYVALLEADGWERNLGYRVDPSPGTVAQAWEKGRWNVQIRVAGPGSEPRQFGTLVPAALTKVDLYFNGQR
jgi:hypothetical protein